MNNLKVRSNVVLTDSITPVIERLDYYFGLCQMKGEICSGLRDVRDQMRIMIGYCVKFSLKVDFTVEDSRLKLDSGLYVWQYNWSMLLNKGVIINPPVPAEALFDYIKPDGRNLKGIVIPASPHFSGKAFDISGIEAVKPVMMMVDKEPLLIRSYVVERANDCVHVNVA